MKTLKKTLCLVLAVVMAVGVLILPANADMETYRGFDDKTEIDPDYELAVATLTGMGIITGKSDTAFVPSAPVTRAEAASLIVATLTTPAGRALAVLGSDHPFTDVGEAHKWADGNIGYAYEAGIVTGKTDTTFVPNATVTGFELLTMLMKATGYEPKNATASWTSKAVEFALEYDIFETGLEDVIADPNKALTREETAQMIWQAINHSPDGTVTVGYLVYVEKGTNTVYDAGVDQRIDTVDSLVEALLVMQTWTNSHTGDVVSYTRTQVNTGSIGDTLYHLQFNEDVDTYGRSTYGYIDSSKTRNNLYSSLTVPADKVYTDGVKLSDALKAIGYKKDDEVSVSITTNSTPAAATTFKIGTTTDIVYKPGQRVEVYDEGTSSTKAAKVVVIDTYVHVLAEGEVKAATATEKAKVEFTVGTNTYTKETNEFTKGQVVIYTAVPTTEANKYNIVDMSVANFFKDTVTATSASGGYLRLSGAGQKYVSANALKRDQSAAPVINTDAGWTYDKLEYTYYEDSYGHLIYATTEQVAEVPTNYIYVVKEEARGYSESGDLIETAGQSAIAKARVIDLETGSVMAVNLAVGYNSTTKQYCYKNEYGVPTNVEVGSSAVLTQGFYKFAVLADGTYAILRTPVASVPVSLAKNKANITATEFANGSTKLCVTVYDDAAKSSTFTTYNGFGSFPTYNGQAIVVAGDNHVATKIYVVTTSSIEPTSTPVNFAVYKGAGEKIQGYQYYDFYVNGKVESYIGADNLGSSLATGKVYDLEVADGVVTVKPFAETMHQPTVKEDLKVAEPTYIVAGNNLYYLSSSTVIVDATNGYAVVDALTVGTSTTNLAVYYTESNGTKTAAFILIVPSTWTAD